VSFIASRESLRSLLWSPDLWFYGPRIRRCVDLRPNKDGAWKLCKIGDLQDCEKTLAVHVHETGLMENRGEVTRNRSSPSKLSQAKLQPTKGKRHRLSPASLQITPIALFRRCRMDRRAIPSAHFSPSLSPRRNCPKLAEQTALW